MTLLRHATHVSAYFKPVTLTTITRYISSTRIDLLKGLSVPPEQICQFLRWMLKSPKAKALEDLWIKRASFMLYEIESKTMYNKKKCY